MYTHLKYPRLIWSCVPHCIWGEATVWKDLLVNESNWKTNLVAFTKCSKKKRKNRETSVVRAVSVPLSAWS